MPRAPKGETRSVDVITVDRRPLYERFLQTAEGGKEISRIHPIRQFATLAFRLVERLRRGRYRQRSSLLLYVRRAHPAGRCCGRLNDRRGEYGKPKLGMFRSFIPQQLNPRTSISRSGRRLFQRKPGGSVAGEFWYTPPKRDLSGCENRAIVWARIRSGPLPVAGVDEVIE